jgi:hypothetical protein
MVDRVSDLISHQRRPADLIFTGGSAVIQAKLSALLIAGYHDSGGFPSLVKFGAFVRAMRR